MLFRYGGNAASGMTLSDAANTVSPSGSSQEDGETVVAPPSTPENEPAETPSFVTVDTPVSEVVCQSVEPPREGDGGNCGINIEMNCLKD